MWPQTFERRLEAWTQLRAFAATADLVPALHGINDWWQKTPWQPYHLHWDDQADWPDPWQLLSDNVYCPLARGLGILYTIAMIDRPDLQNAVLTEVDGHNLVLTSDGKYILNWEPGTVLNTTQEINPRRRVLQQQITHKYN